MAIVLKRVHVIMSYNALKKIWIPGTTPVLLDQNLYDGTQIYVFFYIPEVKRKTTWGFNRHVENKWENLNMVFI